MAQNGVVNGVKISSTRNLCWKGYILGKSHRTPIPMKSHSISTTVLEIVHSEVLGPIEVPSIGGSRYVIAFIDDYSNCTVEYKTRKKSDSLQCFNMFKLYYERHTNQILQKLNIHHSNCENYGDDSKYSKLNDIN